MEHQLTFSDLQTYVSSVAEESLKYGQGLGRFNIGEPLNVQYLIDRRKLIEKFQYRIATIGKKDDQMHMGCLNGSVLKEIVVYRSKQL